MSVSSVCNCLEGFKLISEGWHFPRLIVRLLTRSRPQLQAVAGPRRVPAASRRSFRRPTEGLDKVDQLWSVVGFSRATLIDERGGGVEASQVGDVMPLAAHFPQSYHRQPRSGYHLVDMWGPNISNHRIIAED